MQQILVIGKVWPEPASSAAGWRMMQLLQFFKDQSWQITFASAASQGPFSADLTSLGIHSSQIILNDVSFDHFVKELNPTAVLFDRFTSEEQFGWRVAEHCPTALRILDTEDLHALREARHIALKQKRTMADEDLFSIIAQREVAAIYRCDLSLIISEFEMNLLKSFFQIPKQLLHYLPLLSAGANTHFPLPFEERQHFISIGNFYHAPNRDAVIYLREKIWPIIRKQLPKAELHIYGAYADESIQQVHHPGTGFLIKGRAENALQVMSKARVCLAPLRFGAGQKGKLVLAMECGTPSVTTAIGAEGMQAEHPWPGFVTDAPEQFVQAAIQLYSDGPTWKQVQANALPILKTIFSPANHLPKLEHTIRELIVHLKAHRLKNFTGFMLRQQALQGTKYMALYIAAKNKIQS